MTRIPANSVLHLARAIGEVQGQLRVGEELIVEVHDDRADLVVQQGPYVMAGFGSVYFARPSSKD